MEYHGKLYGKLGSLCFDTGKTSKDFDEIVEMLKKAKSTIGRLRLSMSVHPDCEENSEFADYVDLADEQEQEIELIIKKVTK